MADATTNRRTREYASNVFAPQQFHPAAASTHYFAGTMKCTNPSNGQLRSPAVANAATDRVAGVVKIEVDNTAGNAGDKDVELLTGTFEFDVAGSGGPTVADLEKTVFAVDDQTIVRSAAAGVPAGTLKKIEGTKCWVEIPASGAPNAAS